MENIREFVIDYQSNIAEVLTKIEKNRHGFLIIVNEQEVAVGVVTDGDIRRYLIKYGKLPQDVGQVCVRDFEYLNEGDNFEVIANKFKQPKNNFLPVLSNNFKMVNILTKKQFHLLLLEDQEFNLAKTDFSKLNNKIIEHEIYNRPWGFYKSTVLTSHAQAKVITIFPGEQLSLQKHRQREEHWVVIKGVGRIVLGESVLNAYPGKYIYIPKGCKHKAVNVSDNENLVFSEVQLGEYFGEDDIVRYDDKYGRT